MTDPMTDTLSREQVEALRVEWNTIDPVLRQPSQGTHWEGCWHSHRACAHALKGELIATALAVMDENERRADANRALQGRGILNEARIAHLAGENSALQRMLEKATTRIGILLDRMASCDATSGHDVHELSLNEAPAWIDEQTALLSSPGRAPETSSLENAQGASAAGTPPETLQDADTARLDWMESREYFSSFFARSSTGDGWLTNDSLADDRHLTLRAAIDAAMSRVREAAGRVTESTQRGDDDDAFTDSEIRGMV